jgi:hypothetical protein
MAGTITQSHNGLINYTDFSGVLPSWLTAVTVNSGTVTVAGGVCDCNFPTNTDGAYITLTDPMDKDSNWVIRSTAKWTGAGGGFFVWQSGLWDAASSPTGATAWPGSHRGAHIDLRDGAGAYTWGTGSYIYSTKATSSDTFYIFETNKSPDTVLRFMNLSLEEQATGVWSYTFTNDPYWLAGNPHATYESGHLIIDKLVFYEGVNIIINGMTVGNGVRLYDAGDVVLAEGEADGSGILFFDTTTIDLPIIDGRIKVFTDDSFTTQLADSGILSYIVGGDTYTYAAGTSYYGDLQVYVDGSWNNATIKYYDGMSSWVDPSHIYYYTSGWEEINNNTGGG